MTHPTSLTPFDWTGLYNRFVAGLRSLDVGGAAPRIGERMPAFALPDSLGRFVALEDRLGRGPLVISFMRGGWCPHCRRELEAWHRAIPRLEQLGGHFIAISAEAGGRAEQTRCNLAPEAEMLCDIDHGLALALGLAFSVNQELHDRYVERGLELADIYGNSGRILPIPATFVLDAEGVVRFAFVEPDFRLRPDPDELLAIVEQLASAARPN